MFFELFYIFQILSFFIRQYTAVNATIVRQNIFPMCEAGINVKVIQDTLGHQDISTTMNIYTDATKEMKKQEFESLDNYLKKAV